MFFGKHFSSMYDGSMIGAGAIVFAVMGYIIAKQQPDKKIGSQVRLNSKLLAPILGESEEDVEKAIEYLCAPDPESTTKREQGRRLIKIGQFDYQVVNGAKYLAIRNEETRRAQNRDAQRRFRTKNTPQVTERDFDRQLREGTVNPDGTPVVQPEPAPSSNGSPTEHPTIAP